MAFFGKANKKQTIQFPGINTAANGTYPIFYCGKSVSDMQTGHRHQLANQDPLPTHFESTVKTSARYPFNPCEAAETIGLALTGQRVSQIVEPGDLSAIQDSLFAMTGKRLPIIVNLISGAPAQSMRTRSGGHDDYHLFDNTGFIQFFARNAQAVSDLNLIARKVAELSLNPAVVAQDCLLTSHMTETVSLPENELIDLYLGKTDDIIACPTPAQRLIYGETRRRVPMTWDVDKPLISGSQAESDSYMAAIAAQRPYFFEHVPALLEICLQEWSNLTGRVYQRATAINAAAADYLIIAQGSVITALQAVADHLKQARGITIGIIELTLFRPFPGDLIGQMIKGKKGLLILERTDTPLAEDLPISREIRAVISKCLENGRSSKGSLAYPDYARYQRLEDAPAIYTGSFGLGGQPVEASELLAAIENMLPGGQQKKFFYTDIRFIKTQCISPKQEIHQQQLELAYPGVRELSIEGQTSTPIDFTNKSLCIHVHGLGGFPLAEMTRNLTESLAGLLLWDVKSAPGLLHTKHSFPLHYQLVADRDQVECFWERQKADIALVLDPNFFSYHTSLADLNDHGILVLINSTGANEIPLHPVPARTRQQLADKNIRVYCVDNEAEQEHKSHATQRQSLQGCALQGALFKLLPQAAKSSTSEEQIQSAVDERLADLFDRWALSQTQIDTWHHGYNAVKAYTFDIEPSAQRSPHENDLIPPALLRKPVNPDKLTDIHRFWDQTGFSYVTGQTADHAVAADPFAALGVTPAATSIFRDLTPLRHAHPLWIPENCTACGDCYAVCPDTAIPGLINTVSEVFESNIKRIEKHGRKVKHLRRAVRHVEKKYHQLTADKSEGTALKPLLAKAIGETVKDYPEEQREEVDREFDWFKEAMGEFKFALVKPYHDAMNKRQAGSGGLYSITIDPYACKGCMECVKECEDGALIEQAQSAETIQQLRADWDYWLDLPTSNPKFDRIDDLSEKIGALHTLLQDKRNYLSLPGGDHAPPGSGQKSIVHLFTATLTALMQPRVKQHIAKIDQTIIAMEGHIRQRLAENLDISDADAIEEAIDQNHNVDLTLTKLSHSLDGNKASRPIDKNWLSWSTRLVSKLKQLKWQYLSGISGTGRADMGICNSADSSADWGATFPFSPYPFPWTCDLLETTPSVAAGIFEGHMAKMAEGFKTLRIAELEIAKKYDNEQHDAYFAQFSWRQFNDEEMRLCPPVVCIGSEKALTQTGTTSLSRVLATETPIKIIILSETDYPLSASSLLNGQARARQEVSLFAMAHRNCFFSQCAQSHLTHMLEGFIDGLNYPGPAVWNVYAADPERHGIGDDMATRQSKMAVEARAFPLCTFQPWQAGGWRQQLSLAGNPQTELDWSTYALAYTDEYGNPETIQLPLTFADWALTEPRFRPHFTRIDQDSEAADLVLLHDYMQMDPQQQTDHRAFVWAVENGSNRLIKMLVDPSMIAFTEERRNHWRLLKNLTGQDETRVDPQSVAAAAKAEAAQSLVANLLRLATENQAEDLLRAITQAPAAVAAPTSPTQSNPPSSTPADIAAQPTVTQSSGSHEPVWIDTPDCTTCDECVEINPKIFQYNDDKKAIIVDPTAGTFEDIVKAAEKCTAVIIHPGTPWNADEPNLDKLIKRAEKFQ